MGGKHNGMSNRPTAMTQTTHQKKDRKHSIAGPRAEPFESAFREALEAERIADARTMVANAEAVLFGHTAAEPGEPVSPAQLAAAKARIAIATGDGAAARAILVQAIERHPTTTALRVLMTEVMFAEGRATDVRPVLQHLGNSKRAQDTKLTDADGSGPTLRDTSG